jgi:uncharacterized protein YihD (DUF1040 family)
MRDIERIEPICNTIKEIWTENPDLRLGQLLCNVIPEGYIYFIEDDDLINTIKNYYKGGI